MRTKENKTAQTNQSKAAFFQSKDIGGFFSPAGELKTGEPGDQYEQEADQMADFASSHSGMNQYGTDLEEPDFLSGTLDLEEQNMALEGFADATVEAKIRENNGSGQKMEDKTRSEMEAGLGADFSQINIHDDEESAYLNTTLGAETFTVGKDVYFNKGNYNPESSNGKHLLAHELTHTIQQTGSVSSVIQFTIGDNRDLMSPRFSGDPVLEACLDGERVLQQGSHGAAVTSIQQALIDAGFPLPQFGADGAFGTETRNAVMDFQRASSLVEDGRVGPATMSALDALYSGGAPALPPAIPVTPPPTTAPTVTSETLLNAPDGTANTRTTVGVGERVRLTGNTAGTWTATEGRILGINTGSNVVWEAPAVAANPVITLTTPGGATAMNFTVIAPDSLDMVVNRHDAIAVGTAGACMITDVTVNPLNVSFGRTQWLEVPGPASNISGYFTRFRASELRHRPNPRYLPFNDQNTGLIDHAAFHEAPPPFSFGTFDWVIPNRYKIDGEPDAQGRFFVDTTQEFTIFDDGLVMIDKAGALVTRTTANVIT
jgi:peptidoglycan hydrolase-like protein with peptidoglycan-binding domain